MPRTRKTTRTGVAKAGKKIARSGGMEAVTIRAVASALEVTPMALYHHVGSAEGLRAATLDLILVDVASPPGEGSVAGRLRAFAVGARAVLPRYPGAAGLTLSEWPQLVQGCRILESLLATAATATRRSERQVDIANGVFVYVLTRVILERVALAGGRNRTLPMVDAHPDRFPHLSTVQERFMRIDVDRHFTVGLDALLDGLLPRSPR